METRKRKAVRIRPKTAATSADAGPRFAVFTAVDGTLLDARTFDAGANRTTIRRLTDAGIPVIPVSVMTLDELEPFASGLGLERAMVIEAGGAIARWSGDTWQIEPCGPYAEELLGVLGEIEQRSGASLLVYSALPAAEAARLSGRSGALLQASIHRRFTEPFVIERGSLAAVRDAAASLGFSVRAGRRFLHLCRECDEGEAFVRLRDELRCEVTVALGGAAVDAEFLSRADISIILPGPDGGVDPELLAKVPEARIAPCPAPEGWSLAVEDVWQELDKPKRRGREPEAWAPPRAG